MLSQVLVYKLVAGALGKAGFSEYAVARRVSSLVQPLLLLGLAVGMPRYIALAEARGKTEPSNRYFNATVAVTVSATLVCSALFAMFGHPLSFVFFGSSQYIGLLPPLATMLIGLTLHGVMYAYLRGRLAMWQANSAQFANMCVVPLLVFVAHPRSARAVLWITGAGWTLFAALGLLLVTPIAKFNFRFNAEIRQLLRYGVQRVPGDFAFMALFALPTLIVTHVGGLPNGGMTALSISIVSMITGVFAPAGIILLPKVSRSLSLGALGQLRQEIMLLRNLAILIPAAGILVIELGANLILRVYLGRDFVAAASILRVSTFAALPLGVFCAMRSVTDAVYDNAVNTVNLLVVLAAFGCAGGLELVLHASTVVVLWTFVGSAALLAVLTNRDIQKIIDKGGFPSAGPAVAARAHDEHCLCDGEPALRPQ
jgi:O-antigen/teichoic acid export membrane protein